FLTFVYAGTSNVSRLDLWHKLSVMGSSINHEWMGRGVTDNIMLAQELILDIDKKCRGGNMVTKLDIRKTYDSVSWEFILNILKARVFFSGLLKNESLWANFMHGKYCCFSHPAFITWRLGNSIMWKRLLLVRDWAKNFIFWDVGSGNLSFWHDCWSHVSLHLRDTTFSNLKVSDTWVDGHWNLPLRTTLLGMEGATYISNIPIDPHMRDTPVLKLPLASSITKSIYVSRYSFHNTPWGQDVWSWALTPSMSFLAWRIFRLTLPCDDILKMKGLRIVSHCCLCNSVEETLEHIFFLCPCSLYVWKMAGLWFGNIITQARNLLLTSLRYNSERKRKHFWQIYPYIICWFIWMARNDIIHEEKVIHNTMVFSNIIPYINKLWRLGNSKNGFFLGINYFLALGHTNLEGRRSLHPPILVKWSPPPTGLFKINTDGSWNVSEAGCGGIIRNFVGDCILFFSSPSNADYPIEVEARAILNGAILAHYLSWRNIIFECDNRTLIDILDKGVDAPWDILYHIRRIKGLLSNVNVIWSFNYLDDNQPANWIAKLGSSAQTYRVGSTPPPPLNTLLVGDNIDVPYIRRVASF
ncbi:uncharacterized protein LOC110032464, partial [Phalaenopsis equestris]|uniref:uncharacterized protein LOC110032464 n=1 Tax=Phalaenopsis equestris TaxID=78828 RepID=UPI0009E45861